MAIKFDRLAAGMTLLSVTKERLGNTTMKHWAERKVVIVSVDTVTRTAIVSWNGNRPVKWRARELERMYLPSRPPKVLRDQRERDARRASMLREAR